MIYLHAGVGGGLVKKIASICVLFIPMGDVDKTRKNALIS